MAADAFLPADLVARRTAAQVERGDLELVGGQVPWVSRQQDPDFDPHPGPRARRLNVAVGPSDPEREGGDPETQLVGWSPSAGEWAPEPAAGVAASAPAHQRSDRRYRVGRIGGRQ